MNLDLVTGLRMLCDVIARKEYANISRATVRSPLRVFVNRSMTRFRSEFICGRRYRDKPCRCKGVGPLRARPRNLYRCEHHQHKWVPGLECAGCPAAS